MTQVNARRPRCRVLLGVSNVYYFLGPYNLKPAASTVIYIYNYIYIYIYVLQKYDQYCKKNMIIDHLLLSTIQKDDWLRWFFWSDQSHQPDSNDDTQAACVIIFSSFFTTCVYSLYHKTSNDQFHGPCFSNGINDYKYDWFYLCLESINIQDSSWRLGSGYQVFGPNLWLQGGAEISQF